MVKTTDEKGRSSEFQRAVELLHDETFRALVETSIDAHSERIKHQAGDIGFDGMSPDIQAELAELQVAKFLLEEPEKKAVYRVTSTQSATYIKFASAEDVNGEWLKLSGTPKREVHNPIWQLSVRVFRPEPDPYKHSPEEIVANTPKAEVTIMPEQVYLDRQGSPKFKACTGVTVSLYEGGRAEVFGAKGTGNILYTTVEPIAVIESPEIYEMMEKLP